ncbi:MAG: App1 family protein [Spirochaetales bacterium]
MGDWKKTLNEAIHTIEQKIDRVRYGLRDAFNALDEVNIVAYNGYGTRERIRVQGRVLEERGITPATEEDSLLKNLVNTMRRLDSNEVPYAKLVARFQDDEYEVQCDEEGMFDLWIDLEEPLPKHQSWHTVEFELVDPIPNEQEPPIKAEGHVMVPPEDAKYVVISDIDDTVIEMQVGHLIQMMRELFLSNAYTRLPFPGVAALYRAFHAGSGGSDENPLLYLSSSPWNLYDLLADFFKLHGIPNGPVLSLRNYGITDEEILPLDNYRYKTRTIRDMLEVFDDRPFILIGDSGQQDPEIYASIVDEFPERVLGIYIRNVSQSPGRSEEIQKLAQKVIDSGSSLVLADNSQAIAEHAAEKGWIQESMIPHVESDRERDEQPEDDVDRVMKGKQETDKSEPSKIEGKRSEDVSEERIEQELESDSGQKNEPPKSVHVEGDERKQKQKEKK